MKTGTVCKNKFFVCGVVCLLVFLGLFSNGCQTLAPSPTVTATPVSTATPSPTPTPALPTPISLEPMPMDEVAARLGVDLGGVGDRALEFVDVAKTLRRWESINADACAEGDAACRYVPLDEAGWPTTDARTVFFDKRPFGAWWSADQSQCPNCQDGDFMINVSGTYKLSFTGQATLQAAEGMVDVRNQRYDQTLNTTTADIIVQPGQGLLYINFVNTKRAPGNAPNTGIADVRLLRPGYDLDTQETFTPYILDAVQPFSTLRFMNWVGGNNINPPFESDDNILEWSERNLPTMRQNQGEGVAWEYVVELANLANKHIWINIPIHASDDYVEGLARLLKDTLHEDALIYIESSNEVWNSLFSQHAYNQAAAEAEVEAGGSNLKNDGTSLAGLWGQRRHVRRLVEISNIFRRVFGDAAINDKVRVIHSWWILEPTAYHAQLQWVADTYGPPSDYLYAVAATGYFGVPGVLPSMSIDEMFKRMRSSSAGKLRGFRQMQDVADAFDLHFALYEAGPNTAEPLQWDRDTELLLKLIDLHRDPRMKNIVLYALWNNWFAHPELDADMYIYFTLQSQYNRWGMWGATEDITNLQTPKFQALYDVASLTHSPPPAPLAVEAQAFEERAIVLTWAPSFHAEHYAVKRSTSDGGAYRVIVDSLEETVYLDEGVQVGVPYYYVISATNAQGESRDSAQVDAVVSTP